MYGILAFFAKNLSDHKTIGPVNHENSLAQIEFCIFRKPTECHYVTHTSPIQINSYAIVSISSSLLMTPVPFHLENLE
jgi:hypothetical protein